MEKSIVDAPVAYGLNRVVTFSKGFPHGVKMPSTADIIQLLQEVENGTTIIDGVMPGRFDDIETHWFFKKIENLELDALVASTNDRYITDEALDYVEFSPADVLHMMANNTSSLQRVFNRPFVIRNGDSLDFGLTIQFDYEDPQTMKLPFYMSFLTCAPGSYYDMYIDFRKEGATVDEFLALLNFAGVMEFDVLSDASYSVIHPAFQLLGRIAPGDTRMQWLWLAYKWVVCAGYALDVDEGSDIFYIAQNTSPEAALQLLSAGASLSFIRKAIEDDLDPNVMLSVVAGQAA